MATQSQMRVYGNLGTLYSRCGGVFGVSAFVDRCMDKWMADPTLNANVAVATWHEKAQRCGFKFLVVQIVCNLTGGPQQYTGRPMDTCHKHLNIDDAQWQTFMEVLNEVCAEFGLSGDVVDDLNVLMISMEEDCVVQPGEPVPRNPGLFRPGGASSYSRLGGVYPIALFVDRLVDALLEDERVRLPQDAQKRNEASLKYLFTELVCNLTGGPEVVTSIDSEETKLLVPKVAWRIFLAMAERAADHLPPAARPGLLQTLQRSKYLIVDQASAEGVAIPVDAGGSVKVKDVWAAAAGKMLSREAIAARHAAPGAHVAARKRVHGDPRTLYGRGGGVFGLAKLADRLMDVWMTDPALNANAMVARWHESRQKFGFKFLVTQIMGYLTGGPQRYTGRPMEEAHKHLNISPQQWDNFMQGAKQVFAEFRIEPSTHQEMCGILLNFQADCVVQPGEAVPPDPGASKPGPATAGTLYHNLGGIYPIAHFVDRLVESVLRGDRGVRVNSHRVDDPASSRHPPGLKYMVTELVCSYTGGPEVVTSKGFEDAKLGVDAFEWPAFLALAAEAAEVWPSIHLRSALLRALGEMKVELCAGCEGTEGGPSPEALAVRRVEDAGFGYFEATAALDKCGGSADKALELLTSGWLPAPAEGLMLVSSASSLALAEQPRCPFFANNLAPEGRLPDGHPPVRGAASLASDAADDPLASAARVLATKGVPPTQIAALLGMDEASVMAALTPAASGAVAGRMLGNALQVELDELLVEDPDLCCPISLMLFSDPVIASDGFMYERASLETLLKQRVKASPMTREELKGEYLPAKQRKSDAMEYRQRRVAELLDFAGRAAADQPQMGAAALDRVSEYLVVLKPGAVPTMAKRAVQLFGQIGQPVPAVLGGAA